MADASRRFQPSPGGLGGRDRTGAARRRCHYVVGKHDHGGTAYGWAMEDTTGFCKILADPEPA